MNGFQVDLRRVMEIFKNLKVAKEMDIDPVFTMNSRRRYLTSKLWEIENEIKETIAIPWKKGGDVASFILIMQDLEAEKALCVNRH
jgi:hypothetical protein